MNAIRKTSTLTQLCFLCQKAHYSQRIKQKFIDIQLVRDVPKVGKAGEVVKVRPGQMRYHLFPQKKARYVVQSQARIEVSDSDEVDQAIALALLGPNSHKKTQSEININYEDIAESIKQIEVLKFNRLVIDNSENLHGSVTATDVADELVKHNIIIDKSFISIPDDRLKMLGNFLATISLPSLPTIQLNIEIKKQE